MVYERHKTTVWAALSPLKDKSEFGFYGRVGSGIEFTLLGVGFSKATLITQVMLSSNSRHRPGKCVG